MDLSTLNEAQRRAVTAGDGAHLVIAGAGTGKTRTLVHRVAWLLDKGVAPEHIVLLTFTRRAAWEMLQRVSRTAGPQAHRVRGGTFHGFAHTILRHHAAAIERSPDFSVLDRSDSEEMVGLVRARLGLGDRRRRFPKARTLLKVLSSAVNTGRSLEEALLDVAPQFAHELPAITQVQAHYAARKQQVDALDFDDLLVELARLLQTNPEARKRISGSCRHVLVDEYQDTNKLQARIALLLSVAHGNLMVVGDEAQSIYRFRGAAIENILQFPQILPDTTTTLLTTSYRSTDAVLSLANGVLQSATVGYDKVLRSAVGEGPAVRLVAARDEDDQAQFVVDEVLRLREEGVSLREMAVLVRSGQHANPVELSLSRANVPFKKFGGLQLSEAAHVKDLLSLLRVARNPRDALAWYRVLPWADGIGKTSAQKAADAMASGDPRQPSALIKRSSADLLELEALIERVRAALPDLGPTLEVAVDGLSPWLKKRYDDAPKRARDLESIVLLSHRFADLPQFLAELTLDPPGSSEAQADDKEDEWLSVSTIHSAKGLEWRVVFVIQLGDGSFPSGYALDDGEAMEEERRLLYVAVTRAKRELFLVEPRFIQRRFGTMTPGCSLLQDIPELDERVERVDAVPEAADGAEPKAPAESAGAEDRLARLLDFFGD